MTQDTGSKKPRNWGKIALVGSLALNLLVAGLVIGAFARFDGGPGHHGDRGSMGLGAFINALPEAKQEQVRAASGFFGEDRKVSKDTMRKKREAFEQTLLAQPFSEPAARAAIKEHRDYALGFSERMQEALVTAVADLSDSERANFAAQVEQAKEQRKTHKKYNKP